MMSYKLIIKISAVLLVGIVSIISLVANIKQPSAKHVTVAQKQDTCDNFKILSPIGQVDVDTPTYFSWTAVDEADEYILIIVDDKGNVADKLYLSSDQTWVYYIIGSIQVNQLVGYKIYAQNKKVHLCSTFFEPIDPLIAQLSHTPIPSLTPTPYFMRKQDDKVQNLNIFTPTPTMYFTQN